MRRILARIAVVTGLMALAVPALGQVLYGAIGTSAVTSNLMIINPANGALVSTVGAIGYAVTGLAVHPTTGVLYGSTSNNSGLSPGSLISINKATGAGTLIGSFGFPGQTMADLTFTSDGTLYGWLEANVDDLHTINLVTGAATVVGNSGLSTFGSGLGANGANVLYYSGDGNRGELRTINRTTGLPATVATLSGGTSPDDSPLGAIKFSPGGVMYAVIIDFGQAARPTQLVTINPATAVITDLGPSVNMLDAIAFDGAPAPAAAVVPVPTLSQWALIIMAVLLAGAAMMVVRRRVHLR
jgi:hypothetical protein